MWKASLKSCVLSWFLNVNREGVGIVPLGATSTKSMQLQRRPLVDDLFQVVRVASWRSMTWEDLVGWVEGNMIQQVTWPQTMKGSAESCPYNSGSPS